MSKDMILYHGTSLEFCNEILKKGLSNPYLTSSKELAHYYAEASDGYGEEVVLEVHITDVSKLRVDYPSLYEPVGFGNIHSKTLEDNVELMFNEFEAKNITFTDCDYQVSLNTVYTCKYDGVISSTNLKVVIPVV